MQNGGLFSLVGNTVCTAYSNHNNDVCCKKGKKNLFSYPKTLSVLIIYE